MANQKQIELFVLPLWGSYELQTNLFYWNVGAFLFTLEKDFYMAERTHQFRTTASTLWRDLIWFSEIHNGMNVICFLFHFILEWLAYLPNCVQDTHIIIIFHIIHVFSITPGFFFPSEINRKANERKPTHKSNVIDAFAMSANNMLASGVSGQRNGDNRDRGKGTSHQQLQ